MSVHDFSVLVGSRVLVVEDDPFIAMELQDRLAGLGAKVVGPVPAVGAALREIGAAPPDAVVLDVNLRGEISTPVANMLSEADVPFVVVTGYSRGQLDPELREAPILSKPVSPCEVAIALEGLLRQTRQA